MLANQFVFFLRYSSVFHLIWISNKWIEGPLLRYHRKYFHENKSIQIDGAKCAMKFLANNKSHFARDLALRTSKQVVDVWSLIGITRPRQIQHWIHLRLLMTWRPGWHRLKHLSTKLMRSRSSFTFILCIEKLVSVARGFDIWKSRSNDYYEISKVSTRRSILRTITIRSASFAGTGNDRSPRVSQKQRMCVVFISFRINYCY